MVALHIKNVLTVAPALSDGSVWEMFVFRPLELLDLILQRAMTLAVAVVVAVVMAVVAVVVVVVAVPHLQLHQRAAALRLDVVAVVVVAMMVVVVPTEAAVVQSGAAGLRDALAVTVLPLALVRSIVTNTNQRLAIQLLAAVPINPVMSVLSVMRMVNARARKGQIYLVTVRTTAVFVRNATRMAVVRPRPAAVLRAVLSN